MNTKISHFKKWLNGWDERIETHDDRDTQEIICNRLKWSIGTINKILNDTTDKAIHGLTTDEEKAKAIIKNENKKFYKDLQKVSDNILVTMVQLQSVYELKNRKSYDTIKLRAKIAKMNSNENKI